MQRLAENVMGAVTDIKVLTGGVRESTGASVIATEDGTKQASDTTRSARQIALIIQQQQSGTEQVSKAMDDVSQIAQQTAKSSSDPSTQRQMTTLENNGSVGEPLPNQRSRWPPVNISDNMRERLMQKYRTVTQERLDRLNNTFLQLQATPDDVPLTQELMREITRSKVKHA